MVTETMVERLAQALKQALRGYDASDDLVLIDERHNANSLRELARVALFTMRVPTNSMRTAGSVYFDLDDPDAAKAACVVYRDMIEAALAE